MGDLWSSANQAGGVSALSHAEVATCNLCKHWTGSYAPAKMALLAHWPMCLFCSLHHRNHTRLLGTQMPWISRFCFFQIPDVFRVFDVILNNWGFGKLIPQGAESGLQVEKGSVGTAVSFRKYLICTTSMSWRERLKTSSDSMLKTQARRAS